MTSPLEMAKAAEARRKRFEQARGSITPQQASSIGSLGRQNPSLLPGALVGAGMAGVRPGTPAADALNQGSLQVQKDKGGNWFQRGVSFAYKQVKVVGGALTPDIVGEGLKSTGAALKGVARGAEMTLSAIPQAAQGAGRAWYADGEFELSDLAEGVKQTDLYQAHREVQDQGGYAGLVTGKTDVDFGSGFFAGGDVGRAAGQARVDASGGKRIGGEMYTAGRFLANSIGLEPGNKAYNIVSGLADASVALGLDPSSYAAAPTKALKARGLFAGDASKGFDAAATAAKIDERLVVAKAERFGNDPEQLKLDMGALPGVRDTVASDRVLEFLTVDKRGQNLVEYISKATDFGDLYDATKGKLPPELLLELTKREMTGDEVIEILGPQLGRTARTDAKFKLDAEAAATLPGAGLGTRATAEFLSKKRSVRTFGTLGGERVLPKDDLNEALRRADLFMKNAKISKTDEVVVNGKTINRSEILRRFAQANGGEGVLDVAMDMMKLGSEKAVREYGIDREKAGELFRIFADASSDNRKHFAQRVVDEGETRWTNRVFNGSESDMLADGTGFASKPHLASQFWSESVPLPDPRAIRAELSKFRNLLSNPAIKIPTSALEVVSDNIFKPFVLLRPAYVARNQIDEQFRPAGAGLNSLFSHPVQYLHWLMSDQEGVGRALNKMSAGKLQSRGATFGPDGQYFDVLREDIRKTRDAWQDAKRGGDQAAIDEAKVAYEAAKKATQSSTPFTDEISEFTRIQTGGLGNWRNQSARAVNGDAVFQVTDAGYSRGMGERLEMIRRDPIAKRIAAGDDPDQIKADWWRGPLQGFRGKLAKENDRMAHLNDEIGAAQYVDETAIFVNEVLGQSPELRRAAATGRITGPDGKSVTLTNGDTPEISQAALKALDDLKQMQGYQGPPSVVGSRVIKGVDENGTQYTRAVDWMFHQLANRPTQYLAKSPVFRQRYYQRAENLISFMSDEAADTMIASARKANIKEKDVKRLIAKRRPGGKLTWEEADLVAKADAADYVKEMFYSLHERSQFFDITRLIFPFGEAFFDSAKKYSELVAKNPVLPYRLMQTIEGGRNADPDGDGDGFFYTDEQTEQEMFAFPLVGGLVSLAEKAIPDAAERAVGLDLEQAGAGQMRAPLANLNIMGVSVIPGFGPAVQIGAAMMLPDDADFNGVRELISPYGDRTVAGGIIESFLPSWVQKGITAIDSDLSTPKQQRAFAQAKKDWMGYLASTGEYNLSEPADQQRLMDDSAVKARTTFLIRGLAQAFAPSPPSPEFLAYDKDGKLQTQFRLAEEYRKISDEQKANGTPEATNRIFIETFGEQAVLAVVPNTKAAQDKSPLPPNREALEFFQNNKDAASRFPTVFGLFAPDEDGAEFDWTTYNRSIETGERVVISPEEAIRRANSNVARMIYQNAKDIVGDKPNKQQKEQMSALKAKLSEDFPGYSTAFSNDTPALLEDLKRAAVDPQLSQTPSGQGLTIWLHARELAEKTAQERFGVSWKTAQASREIRDSMRVLAERLSADFPGFSNIYDRALEREMTRD